MEVRFHPEAVAEMISAARHYDICVTGLGARFLEAVKLAASQIQAQPTLGSVDARGRRRRAVRRFPYRLIYRLGTDSVFILAVGHGGRRPGYWARRDL